MDKLPQYLIDIGLLLPLSIRVKFFWNCLTLRWSYGTPINSTSCNMLYHCFYFDESPEGYKYWLEVYKKYVDED
jgi:hypothetical protein